MLLAVAALHSKILSVLGAALGQGAGLWLGQGGGGVMVRAGGGGVVVYESE